MNEMKKGWTRGLVLSGLVSSVLWMPQACGASGTGMYVTQQNYDLEVLDTTNGNMSTITTADIGYAPRDLILAGTGMYLLIPAGAGSMKVVDTSTLALTEIPFSESVEAMYGACTAGSNVYFVTAYGQLVTINTTTHTPSIFTLPHSDSTPYIAALGTGIYVSSPSSYVFTVVDANTYAYYDVTAPTSGEPKMMVPGGNRMFIACGPDGQSKAVVLVFDPVTHSKTALLRQEIDQIADLALGGTGIFVGNGAGGGQLPVIDINTLEIGWVTTSMNAPRTLGLAGTGMYVGDDTHATSVDIIDLSNALQTSTVSLSDYAWDFAPAGTGMYVTNNRYSGNGKVYVIDTLNHNISTYTGFQSAPNYLELGAPFSAPAPTAPSARSAPRSPGLFSAIGVGGGNSFGGRRR